MTTEAKTLPDAACHAVAHAGPGVIDAAAIPADEWILAAGATEAHLFRRTGAGGLEPLRTFHAARERMSDSSRDRGPRRIGQASPQRRRHLRFAAALAAHLERGVTEGRCGAIYLLAACPFMGALRRSLPMAVKSAVRATIAMDFCDASDQGILEALAGECQVGDVY